jgi:uncharacterized protein (DUF1499 family)
MSPLAWLASLIMPACGYTGATGLPVPPPMNPAAIVRPATSNGALAGPQSMNPIPDIFVPSYALPPDQLFSLIQAVATHQPRTYEAAIYPNRHQANYVARSEVFNVPDLIMVQVLPDGPDKSDLIIFSKSVYGDSDLGVNHKRLTEWLAALQAQLTLSREK